VRPSRSAIIALAAGNSGRKSMSHTSAADFWPGLVDGLLSFRLLSSFVAWRAPYVPLLSRRNLQPVTAIFYGSVRLSSQLILQFLLRLAKLGMETACNGDRGRVSSVTVYPSS